MIRDAELFVMAEQVLVEVVRRIRAEHWKIVIPPMYDMPGADQPMTLRRMVGNYAHDDAWVPGLLSGSTMDEMGRDRFDGDLLADGDALTRITDAACAAARTVTDGEATVHCSFGDTTTTDYLRQLSIARCFMAHHIAMHLGSRACPLTEELARGMWEATQPDAERWRSIGVFREPLVPVPVDVSWRDRFLMCAGHDPHALDH